jgi:hypothetical protein
LQVFRVSGHIERDLQFFLDAAETNLAFAALGPPETLKLGYIDQQLSDLAQTKGLMFSHSLVWRLKGLPGKDALGYAYSRLARTALAVERFRLAHGRLPESLGELVPEFLPVVPADPFDGQPLRYRVLSKGYMVYSVGDDGHDDGGREHPPATGSTYETNKMLSNLSPVRLLPPGKPASNSQYDTNTYDVTFIVKR